MSVGGCSLFSRAIPKYSKIRIHKRNARQHRQPRSSRRLRQKNRQWQEVRIHARGSEIAEAATLRRVLEIIRPADVVFVQQVKDGSSDWLVAARRRKCIAGRQVSKRSCGQQVRTIGKRGTKN